MQSFELNSLPSKELSKNVFISLIDGKDLTLDYFELKHQNVKIPLHKHPVEHLVIVLEGEMEFIFDEQKLNLKKKNCIFVPSNKLHTAKVIKAPVKALEIYKITVDKYYEK